ncbi:terpenoid synthase [Gyrodon lividus]|nr:terpenoid synthase [Gyrodon lividus]
MLTGVYQLPDLLAILPKKPGGGISPHFKEAETGYNAWVNKKLGWLFAIVCVYNAEMPLLAALTWPLASCQELSAILGYMTSSFMLEELTDRCSSTKAIDISQLWIKTLRDSDGGKTSHHPFIKTMHRELVPTMKAAVDPFHWPQFIAANEQFAKNTVQEALDREAHVNEDAPCNIQSYMVMRRETIGTRPCFVLMRSTRRLYIPDHVLAHPVMEEMEDVALDMVYIANDIYSYKKEYGDNGALNNLLTVIQKDPTADHLNLQERIDYATKLFKAALDRFHACRNKLSSFGDVDLDRQVSSYADGLVDWAVGNIEWSVVNHRYNTFINETDRKNNIMKLNSRHLSSQQLLILFFIVSSILFKYLPARSLYSVWI